MNTRDFLRVYPRYLLPLIALLATLISATFMSQFLLKDITTIRAKAAEQDSFFKCLEVGLANNTFGEEYCKTAFNHFDRKSKGVLSKYGYIELLEDFLVQSGSREQDFKQQYYEKVAEVLKKAKTTEPFASLPSEERRLMDGIQVFVQKNDTASSINALNELKQVILARHKEYERIEKQNSWSLPLAIVGVFLTILFGVWTTVLTLRRVRSTPGVQE
jgi:hypothetical protein